MDRNQVNSLFKFFQDVSALKATVSKTYHGLASLKNSFKFDDVDGYITRALPVPEIVLLGEQSSGKSSFIEALVGDKFNFAQAGMATKIKMFVTVLVDPELKENKWEFKANGKWLVGTKEGVIRMLAEENTRINGNNIDISRTIDLRVTRPSGLQVAVYDLPGFIEFSDNPNLRADIEGLAKEVVGDQNRIIICMEDSNKDVALFKSVAFLTTLARNEPGRYNFDGRTVLIRNKSDGAISRLQNEREVWEFFHPQQNALLKSIRDMEVFATSLHDPNLRFAPGTSMDAKLEVIQDNQTKIIRRLVADQTKLAEHEAHLGFDKAKGFIHDKLIEKYKETLPVMMKALDRVEEDLLKLRQQLLETTPSKLRATASTLLLAIVKRFHQLCEGYYSKTLAKGKYERDERAKNPDTFMTSLKQDYERYFGQEEKKVEVFGQFKDEIAAQVLFSQNMVCGGTNCRRLIDYVFAATSEDDPIDSEVTDEKILTLSSGVMQNNAQLTPQDILRLLTERCLRSMAKKSLPGLIPLRKLIADLIEVSIATLGDILNTPEAEAHNILKDKPALRRELEKLLTTRVHHEILLEKPARDFIDRRLITNEELFGKDGQIPKLDFARLTEENVANIRKHVRHYYNNMKGHFLDALKQSINHSLRGGIFEVLPSSVAKLSAAPDEDVEAWYDLRGQSQTVQAAIADIGTCLDQLGKLKESNI
jgi:GTPase SAR1 family protein